MVITALAATMAVNTLVTGLIVFKILKVFLEIKRLKLEATTSDERTMGSLPVISTGGTKFQHIIFIIIESGMALFVIQLIRVVFSSVPIAVPTNSFTITWDMVVGIHEMLNVIMRSIYY